MTTPDRDPAQTDPPRRGPGRARIVAALLAAGALGALAALRAEVVPPEYLPWTPLSLAEAPNVMTGIRLARTADDGALCLGALAAGAEMRALSPLDGPGPCGIPDRVRLSRAGEATLSAVETQCGVALRLAWWERHRLQPAARRHLGEGVARIEHVGSYSCRRVRTTRGPSERWSEHAFGNAFDISGVRLTGGRRISLIAGWNGDPATAAFLREARDGLCDAFRTVLSPDYNALHADHFHVAQGRWPTCR